MSDHIHGRILGLLVLTPVVVAASAQGFPEAPPRLDAPSFAFARYATASAASLYAARGFGAIGAFVGMVQNPKSSYRELIIGTYTRVTWDRQSVLVALGFADATESDYLQTSFVPSLSKGPLMFSGTIEWYQPLERSGTRQLDVNPISLVLRVSNRFGLGPAYTLGLAKGSLLRQRGGLKVELTPPWGVIGLELLRRSSGSSTELRTAVSAAF